MRVASSAIALFCLAVIMVIGALTPAAALGDQEYAAVERICVQRCSPDGKQNDFCTKYCACTVSELRKTLAAGGGTPRPDEIEKMNFMCGGRVGVKNAVDECMRGCPAGRDCKKACTCLGDQLRAIGSEVDIGRFFYAIGRDDKAAKARSTAFMQACLR